MDWKQKVREPKILSLALILGTLAVGILIGTLIHTEVRADKGSDKPVTDAAPLKIPSPVKLQNEFTAIVNKVEPAVVNISTEYKPKPETSRNRVRPPAGQEGEDEDEGMDLFRRFFRQGPLGESPAPQPRGGGEGSGFIVDPKGYIITNHHVVDDATTIKVKLHGDPAEHKAKLIGFDVETDLAVIKIDAGRALPHVPVGNSEAVQVGDWAIAIGSPFGLEASVTVGIVSAQGRDVAQQFQKFIQTDAAINPGNSGGPLLALDGRVVGLATAIATRSGGYQGIGFAIPIDMARGIMEQIVQNGHVVRGWLGVSLQDASPQLAERLGLGERAGALISAVLPGGPAEAAGVRVGDLVIALNGEELGDAARLMNLVGRLPVGKPATMRVVRAGQELTLQVVPGERKLPQEAEEELAPAPSGVGVTARALDPDLAERFGYTPDSQGVVIVRVEPGSLGAEHGLHPGMILQEVDRQPIRTLDDLNRALEKIDLDRGVLLRVWDGAAASFVLVQGAPE